MPHWFTFWKFIFKVSITGKKHSFPWPKDLYNEVYVNLLKFFTFSSLKPKQISGIAYVSGFKFEWHENFGGFYKTTCEILLNPKVKITRFGDQQASKIRVRTKYFLIRCTRATNLRGLGTPAGMLGSPKGSPKFYTGDQLWGLGALTKMIGSPKGPWNFPYSTALYLA